MLKKTKKLGKIGGSNGSILLLKKAKKMGKMGVVVSESILILQMVTKNLGKYKVFLMAVYIFSKMVNDSVSLHHLITLIT